MATVQMVYDAIDEAADFTLALDFDNPGLLVGDPNEQVRGVLAALDVTDSVIGEAISRGANLIVTHHPVIFHAMKRITSDTLVWKLVRAGISVISAHTNLDIAKGGVNDLLAQKLALNEIEVLELTRAPDGMGRAGMLERGLRRNSLIMSNGCWIYRQCVIVTAAGWLNASQFAEVRAAVCLMRR